MPSAFTDRTHVPQTEEIERTLGPSAALWRELVALVGERFGPVREEWTFAGKAHGWSLRLKRGTRAILYLTPYPGQFNAALVLGEKAVAKAHGLGLSPSVRDAIEAAPRYAEGRAVRLPVKGSDELDAILAVAAAKMST